MSGCTQEVPRPPEKPAQEALSPEQPPSLFERVSGEEVPRFTDDMDRESLLAALEKSLVFLGRVPEDRTYPLGEAQVTAGRIKESLLYFRRLAEEGRTDRETIAREFDIWRVREGASEGKPLVTGYYEPILEGRLERNGQFCYPLYQLPSDLLTIDLSSFDSGRFSGERLLGRLDGNRVVPYYTRAEIDGQKKIEKSAPQLVWLSDPVDAFFLHVQGSGKIRMPNGGYRRLGYAGSNGRPYRSVGKVLLDRGIMTPDEMSLQAIRAYLGANPEMRDEVLWYNESYVFFRWVEDGPLGSLNVPLTAGRSIATDPRYQPRGALVFIETEKPRLNERGEVLAWEPLRRWVLNQDTGGAIKGAGRVDLFCGSGEAAEGIAGRLKHPGKVYFLIKKAGS